VFFFLQNTATSSIVNAQAAELSL
jgi:hypothetical protein